MVDKKKTNKTQNKAKKADKTKSVKKTNKKKLTDEAKKSKKEEKLNQEETAQVNKTEEAQEKTAQVQEIDPAKDAFLSGDEENPTDIPDTPQKQTIEDIAANTTGPAKKYAIARVQAAEERKKRIIIGSITIAICVLSVFGAWLFSFLNTNFESSDDFQVREELTEANFNEPFYMLLVGTDTREKGSYSLKDGRSDSCILVRVDPINYVVTMISIPRDTKISSGSGSKKFNACYAEGGIKKTIKQVKQMMGVDIAHYAEISFNGLIDMVDAVGGVEVDVPSTINDNQTQVYVPAGKQTLNGEQALSFARSRKFGDGDFTRSADQRILIEALIHKCYQADISDVPNLLRAAKNFVKTDLRLGDMVGLATQFITADKDLTLYSAMVPSYTSSEGGISYVITDTAALKRMMKMVENNENPLYVELSVSGASVCSSRDSKNLEAEKKEYYAQHPDSPGRIANS